MGEAMCKSPLGLRASRPPFDALRDGEVRLVLEPGLGLGFGLVMGLGLGLSQG